MLRPSRYDPPPMGAWADRLIDRLTNQEVWPAADDQRVWDQVKVWIAFRENDRNVLRENARWRNQIREYLVDPLGPKINEAFASAIFGAAPTITPAKPEDRQRSQDLVAANNLARRLQREEKRVSGEAETWWRIISNPELEEYPLVDYRSRLDVIPMFHGDHLRAVAFIDQLDPLHDSGESDRWRHFEIVDRTDIVNVLFRGTADTIGDQVGLDEHPDTDDLADTVAHDLPYMPAGRVVNKEGDDPFYGISDFSDIEDFLYLLNEILTIFRENIRLTLKRRVSVPASAVDESGTVDASQEFLVDEALHDEIGKGAGKGASNQWNVLEYSSQIGDVISAQNATAEGALTRIGITPAYVGMTTDKSEGRAVTGTALRLRLIPTVNAAEDRAQYWDDSLPVQLCCLQILDSRPREPGAGILPGFGRPWLDPTTPPGVDRGSSLPEDPIEETEVHAARVSASIESRFTAIKALHPDWEDDTVNEEIDRIKQDALDTPGVGALGGLFETGRTPPVIKGAK